MKRFMMFVLALLLFVHPAFSETTVEKLEKKMGVMIDQADADTLKKTLLDFDEEMSEYMRPYEQYRAKILVRLRSMGQSQWVTNYMGKNQRTASVLSLSYTDLVTLKSDINLAMWMSEEWQEVTVPQGTWEVGKDIPAGHWSVKCAPGAYYTQIDWGESLDENGEDIYWYGRSSLYNNVYNEEYYPDADNHLHVYSFEVKKGDFIKISSGSAVFMPYVGKPSFKFK